MAVENDLGPLPGGTEAGIVPEQQPNLTTTVTKAAPALTTLLDWAGHYQARGWSVIPIPAGRKAASLRGWPKLRATEDDLPRLFGDGGNIGLILGAASAGAVDVDVDCSEALILADMYLPPTDAVFGRPSRPRSHRLYNAPGAVYVALADPITRATLVELRADGRDGGAHMTLLAPSAAGYERREWELPYGEPSNIAATVLARRVAWLAIASLTMRYVSEHAARRPARDLPDLLWEAEPVLGRAAYRWLGEQAPDERNHGPKPRKEITSAELRLLEVVAAIPNDCDWVGWNRVGMAIFAASAGSEEGYIAFDRFSARSPKYDPHAVRERWRNYRRSPPSRIGIGTLVWMAHQNALGRGAA